MGMISGNNKKRKRPEKKTISLAYEMYPSASAAAFRSISDINDDYYEHGNDNKRKKGSGGFVVASKNTSQMMAMSASSSALTASNDSQKQGGVASASTFTSKVSPFNIGFLHQQQQ
jgi:hypothetical protein